MTGPRDDADPGPPRLPPMAPGMPTPGFPGLPGPGPGPGPGHSDPGRHPGFGGDLGVGGDPRAAVYEQLLARRTILVEGDLDVTGATFVAAQLMTLDADGDDPITLLVNSPGGPLDAAATILDTMHLAGPPVDTTCLGRADGTAAVVVASGTGRRRAGAGARFSLRLPAVELAGPASQLADEVAHYGRLRDLVLDRLVEATGANRRMVARDVDRGRSLTADEAVAYGLVDEVLSRTGRGDRQPPPGTTSPDS